MSAAAVVLNQPLQATLAERSEKGHLGALDGLRGVAALWVLLGHAALLTGFKCPVLDRPDWAVDVFILLSGFLMTYHYSAAEWDRPVVWASFLTRRFFRIAPLYYVLLVLSLNLDPLLFHTRDVIAHAVPSATTTMSRYSDVSVANWLMHLTFLFGFSRHYGFETPLPDWSIGLEMAFYGSFPATMLAARRIGLIPTAILVSIASVAGFMICRSFLNGFNEPSFLTLKLPVFMAGAVLAYGIKNVRYGLATAIAVLLTAFPSEHLGGWSSIVARGGALLLAGLIYAPQFRGLALALGGRIGQFIGNASFGVYLIHLLIMLPVAAEIDRVVMSPELRWIIVAAIVSIFAYPIATLAYRYLEMPAHQFGRRITRSW